MSVSEAYQDDHVPEGARPNRWQSLHVVCKYRDHHKPVYPLRRLATATEWGHRAKMRFTKSLRESCRVRGFLFMLGYRSMTCGTTASALLNSLFTVQQIAATFRVNSGTLVTLPQS